MSQSAEAVGLRSVLNVLLVVLEWFSSATILIMMLLTFVDVIGRYLFSQPIFGAAEMVSALLAATIFAGLEITNARDEHIVVELLDHRFRMISPRVCDVIIQSFSIVAMGLVAYVMAQAALEAYHQNARTFVLEIPTFFITSVVATLALISVIS